MSHLHLAAKMPVNKQDLLKSNEDEFRLPLIV